MDGKRGRRVHISRSTVALSFVACASAALTLILRSDQAENLIDVVTLVTLVGVMVRRLGKAEESVKAALQLAEEMRMQREQSPDDELAPVIPMQRRRRHAAS